jgi:hypothetical protein
MPLVLVQNPVIVNEGYEWKDIEGEQYHLPNQYKNRCATGTPFVYYRGMRRPDGKRAAPEYFGHGRIGEVWRDETIPESSPKKDWAWYCCITDYVPFRTPVPAKMSGEFLERIARNHWSVGVRPLPQDVFDKIMDLAGIAPGVNNESITLPDLRAVSVKEAERLLLVPRKPTAVGAASNVPSGRYSRTAVPIGRRAEEIAQRFLFEHAEKLVAKNIRWISQEGLTPGRDLQYENDDGQVIAVEVKGTTGPVFGSVDITTGEWNAAVALADRYWLYLVANCCGTEPKDQPIQNPARLLSDGVAELTPVVYRFSLLERS